MSFTVDDIDAAYQPTKVRASVCLDSDLVVEIGRLEQQLATEKAVDRKTNRIAKAPALAEQILELRERAAAAEVEFVFQGIGRRAYTDLRAKHPPTQEQKDEAAKQGLEAEFNPDTFPPALMAASCIQPSGSTVKWWARKYDEWTVGQISRLWSACLAAQVGVTEVPKALEASAMMSDSEQN